MTIVRLLNLQGIAGIAVSPALATLLALQLGQTRHWKRQSGQYEQLYSQEQAMLAGTIANYRAAADAARAADAANVRRVVSEQQAINEGTSRDCETRLADARVALSGCASSPKPQPIPAVAEQRQCPAYRLPPTDLLKPPAKTDFLSKTH